MSIENLSRFSDVVDRDPVLRRELGAIRDPKELVARAVQMGAERGFAFSAEELEEKSRAAVHTARGELSDKQLGAVSGGVSYVEYPTFALILVACIADIR